MLKIIPYDEKYDDELKSLDPDIYIEAKYHEDVIKEDLLLTVENGRLFGIGYLLASQSYRLLERDLSEYFLHAVFKGFQEKEAEASVMLLSGLMERFSLHCMKNPGKKLVLRLWCKDTDEACRELYSEMGFRHMDTMYVMKRELAGEALPSPAEIFRKASGNRLELVIREVKLTRALENEYLSVNEEAFSLPDSIDDLRFKLRYYNGKLYCAFLPEESPCGPQGSAYGRLAASVTVWDIGTEGSATENIFCLPSCQNMGITKALLGYVLYMEKRAGKKCAALTVYKNDLPAIGLYSSLGYRLSRTLHEMRYAL